MIFFSIVYIIIIICFGTVFYWKLISIFSTSLNDKVTSMMGAIEKNLKIDQVSSVEELKEILQSDYSSEFSPSKYASDYFWVGFYTMNMELVDSTRLAKQYPLDLKKFNSHRKIPVITFENVYVDHPLFHRDSHNKVYALVNIKKIAARGISFYLVIVLPITNESYSLKRLGRATLFSFTILLIISIIAGLVFISYTLRPIKTIAGNLKSISKDDLSQRLKVHNKNDEIGELTIAINNLFQRLEMSFEHERQFITDLSHEFKTPLSILRLTIENVLGSSSLSDDDAESLGKTLETLYSMDFLVQKLLYLSRLEQDKCPFNPHKNDLCLTLDRVFDNLQLLAEGKKLEFKKHCESPELICHSDPDLLYMAFYNIVENSLKYTDKGSVIILAQKKESSLEITIEDTGIGIAQEKLALIFDKFYREDASRSEKKGYGIGLSIAKRIIFIHKGNIAVESIPGIKTKFIITLPC